MTLAAIDPELLFPLRTVIDPELGVNIVDLGLVRTAVRDGDLARIRMTMTTPACPLGPYIEGEIRSALVTLVSGLREVEVEIVHEPPWSPDDMTDDARQLLGG